ncbi:long-chain fatty alcohol dehydrogenase [Xylariaceae sp. FL0662B]|nr:long-chain fatty alcohol dehydrogenase [Xylariaceae sp. FL0662B]
MMAASHLTAPIPTQVPALKPDIYFSETQWKTLFALVDAVVPSIVVDSELADSKSQLRITESQCIEAYGNIKKSMKCPPNYEKFKEYLEERAVDNPRFVRTVKRTIERLPMSDRKRLGGVLNLIATRLGSLAATGYFVPIQEQPLYVRERIIQSWNRSLMKIWPAIGKIFTKLARSCYPQVDPLFLELSGYRNFADDYRPGPTFDFNFLQFEAGPEPATIDTDVVIVGSGCGGAVCAKVLAEAGHKVMVVDKGYYFPPSQLPMPPEAANAFLYEGGGPSLSVDGSVNVVSGSCWGGGGTINWSACLQPQGYVRQEWADKGLRLFTTQEFQHCLDRVWDFMGVSDTYIRHNHGNRSIIDGSRKLGWTARSCPQNTGGNEHYCGNCPYGCGSAEKQGPSVSWLPAAAKAGARFIEGFNASEVLFEENNGSKRAVGVLGKWISRDRQGNLHAPESYRTQRTVQIRAKKVIVAGGSLNSPLLLMRSGLKNPHIGRNLHVHPVSHVNATYDEDVRGWEGGILTSVCTSFENLDGKGHGVKLETASMLPSMMLFEQPWENGLQWKLSALRYRQMNTYISLTRDRDTGRVYPDPDDGRPLVDYTPSAFDRKHILAGVIALAKICYIEGATEIWPTIQGMPSFVRRGPVPASGTDVGRDEDNVDVGINDPDFIAWLKLLEKTGLNAPHAAFTCAHQMGTCRMGARSSDGVVDPNGRVWEAADLYVADASVFPSASGVNPMITVMAIADWIARGISRELKKGELRAAL